MFACTRSLMNRASRSSTNSSAHIISSSDAKRHLRPRVLLAVRREGGENRRHRMQLELADHVASARLVVRDSRHVPVRRRILLDRSAGGPLDDLADQSLARAAALSRSVLAITPLTDFSPPSRSTIAAFLTPLQLHTCASSASSAAPTSGRGCPEVEHQRDAFLGNGSPRSNACIRNASLPTSPTSVAPTSFPSRTTIVL